MPQGSDLIHESIQLAMSSDEYYADNTVYLRTWASQAVLGYAKAGNIIDDKVYNLVQEFELFEEFAKLQLKVISGIFGAR